MTRLTDRWLAWLLAAILLSGGAAASAQQPDAAPVLLRRAIDREVIDGDIHGAIQEYRAIADQYKRTDRATAAEALMRLADAHQRLGNDKARSIYDEIIRDYGDRPDVVTAARSKRAALRSPGPPRVGGPVCTGCVGPYVHSFTMSTDGRWLGYTAANNDLMIRDLETGGVKR